MWTGRRLNEFGTGPQPPVLRVVSKYEKCMVDNFGGLYGYRGYRRRGRTVDGDECF
jgi:hypothetical protein